MLLERGIGFPARAWRNEGGQSVLRLELLHNLCCIEVSFPQEGNWLFIFCVDKFCFVFRVVQTSVGYTQGTTKDPTYRDVCSGKTGHVEAVQVEYNPAEVSYKQLLDVFWKKHDPTQKNRQVRGTLTRPLHNIPPILPTLFPFETLISLPGLAHALSCFQFYSNHPC